MRKRPYWRPKIPIPSDNKFWPLAGAELDAFVAKTYGERALRQLYEYMAPRRTVTREIMKRSMAELELMGLPKVARY